MMWILAIYLAIGVMYSMTWARWRQTLVDDELVAMPSSMVYRIFAGALWLPQVVVTMIAVAIFGTRRLLADNHDDIDTKDPDEHGK